MGTTENEKAIIKEVIRRKTARKYKWAYLLAELIEEKKASQRSYGDLAEWLSKEGLEIRENTLRKLMWDYHRKVKPMDQGLNQPKQYTIETIMKEPEQNGSAVKGSAPTPSYDLNEVLRNREQQLKIRNAGFDAFDGM
ncbi:hypothetical protein ACS5NO_32260 [Larkinella sp. GY13]|uniref:hypothetical protein n=1 Tax=Larkinella sp. GY13 TaxID=3453720 RepID=UPI003EEA4870